MKVTLESVLESFISFSCIFTLLVAFESIIGYYVIGNYIENIILSKKLLLHKGCKIIDPVI
jgi:hypothetical protein